MRSRVVIPGACALVLGLATASADAAGTDEVEARLARAEATTRVWTMEGSARRARGVLQRARERGFAGEVRCADEQLSLVDSALRWGRERALLVGEAWSRGDAARAREELTRVAIAAQAARKASVEAELCIDAPRPPEGTTVRLIIDSR